MEICSNLRLNPLGFWLNKINCFSLETSGSLLRFMGMWVFSYLEYLGGGGEPFCRRNDRFQVSSTMI